MVHIKKIFKIKWAEDLNISPKKIYKWPISILKILNFTNYQGNANQNTMRYYLTHIRMATI